MLTGLSSRPAPRPCSACHQGRFAPAIRPATHARVPLPLKGGRSFATRLLNVSRSVSDDCKGENAAEKPPADPSEASGIWEAFSAESFEAYTAADPQYKDRPVQVKLRSVMSSKDMSSISYVGTSEEERLPAGFKYAGCDKKEVVLLQGHQPPSLCCPAEATRVLRPPCFTVDTYARGLTQGSFGLRFRLGVLAMPARVVQPPEQYGSGNQVSRIHPHLAASSKPVCLRSRLPSLSSLQYGFRVWFIQGRLGPHPHYPPALHPFRSLAACLSAGLALRTITIPAVFRI